MSKAYRVEELEPGIWMYSDGRKRYYGHESKQDGGFCEVPKGGAKPFTQESAKLARHARTEKALVAKVVAQEEAERALQRATRSKTPAEGWGKLTGAVAKRVLDGDEPLTGVVTAYKAVGQSAGMLTDRATAPTQAVQINISLEAAEALRSYGVDLGEIVDAPIEDQPSEYASE